MKKYLPNSTKGFTLIELLVVVAIIAILATISVSVFSGAQGSARDGQRRSEISSIAKSIESSKDYVSGVYKWGETTASNDFPKGIPYDDPQSISYCVATLTSATPPADLTGNDLSTTCALSAPVDTTYKDLEDSVTTPATNNLGATTPDVKSWKICARLERSNTPFCVSSLTK